MAAQAAGDAKPPDSFQNNPVAAFPVVQRLFYATPTWVLMAICSTHCFSLSLSLDIPLATIGYDNCVVVHTSTLNAMSKSIIDVVCLYA